MGRKDRADSRQPERPRRVCAPTARQQRRRRPGDKESLVAKKWGWINTWGLIILTYATISTFYTYFFGLLEGKSAETLGKTQDDEDDTVKQDLGSKNDKDKVESPVKSPRTPRSP